MHCSASPLLDQLMHCGAYALAALMFGAVAVALDRFADRLHSMGASVATLRLLRGSSLWLLGLDLLVLVAQATMSAGRQLWCLAGF